MRTLVVFIGLVASSYGCDYPNNCINGTCHLWNAKPHCTIGCKIGFAGNFCTESCVYTCRSCLRNDPRTCTSCEDGFTGSDCKIIFPEGDEVSTVLPKPRSSCPPTCFQCSDNGTCLKCPGLNGEICRSCGQDGGCLDECGAGCVDKSNSRTESIVGDVPRDTWGQIDNLIKNNALLLPLLCCGLALIVIVTVGVTLKCSGHRRTQSYNMNSASIPEKQKEETLFAKCGDIYHEIEDSQLDSHPLITPVLEEIPRQHSSREQGQGHFQKLHRPDDKQNNLGCQDHNHGSGKGDGAAGPRKDKNQVHRHHRCSALVQDNISTAKKESVTNQNSFVSNSPENQSYITPIQEVNQPDILSTEARSKVDLEQKDVILRSSERSSYVTAISEAENRKIIGGGCNKDINKDMSPPFEKFYKGCKEQVISLSAVVVGERSVDQGELLSGLLVEERCREQCKPPSAVVVGERCREQFVSDHLETNTCTEPEVRDRLLISSSDTEELPEIKLQRHQRP